MKSTTRNALTIMFLLILTACSGTTDGVPTVAPAVQAPTTDASPRDTSDSRLPPTYTPEAAPDGPQSNSVTPIPGSENQAASDQLTYQVVAGDTLFLIAEAHGVSVQTLAEANNIQNIDLIEVGQILVIP